jgi:hypothetical protein
VDKQIIWAPMAIDIDATPIPGVPLSGSAAGAEPAPDPEATANGGFLFGELGAAKGRRQILAMDEILVRLTALLRAWPGCEDVTVLEVNRLDIVDRRDGCNWGLSVVLDPAGVEPEVYALGYAHAIAIARANWNLEPEVRVAVMDFDLG